MANEPETYTVKIVPAQGKTTTKEVQIPATGTSVGEALKAAGIDPSGLELSIGGNPVTVDHHIKPNQELKANAKKAAKSRDREIVGTERARGS